MLTNYLAVVTGFGTNVQQQYPPLIILHVLLKIFPFLQHLRLFQSANANSTYFFSRAPYFELFQQRVNSWTSQHGLPPFSDEDIYYFLEKQWTLHCRALSITPRFTFKKIKHLQQWLPREAILHHADHEQAKLTIFCPRLYFQGAWNTWDDPDLFRRLPITPEEAQQ